jgi:hypothetical protein
MMKDLIVRELIDLELPQLNCKVHADHWFNPFAASADTKNMIIVGAPGFKGSGDGHGRMTSAMDSDGNGFGCMALTIDRKRFLLGDGFSGQSNFGGDGTGEHDLWSSWREIHVLWERLCSGRTQRATFGVPRRWNY